MGSLSIKRPTVGKRFDSAHRPEALEGTLTVAKSSGKSQTVKISSLRQPAQRDMSLPSSWHGGAQRLGEGDIEGVDVRVAVDQCYQRRTVRGKAEKTETGHVRSQNLP